jgi:RHS repeat-associated protein
MADQPRAKSDSMNDKDGQFRVQAPELSLPKGGGAIRGIGEKFAANPVTGTGSLTVPIYTSPGRSGFGPQFSLSYNSGGGNGPFGFGWTLSPPAITRKTDKGLPQYIDSQESDIFILSGAEDLMPALKEAAGQWTRDIVASRTVYSKQYAIHRYRPRVEGLFARIERWINLSDPQDTFWRSITKDNITTWYGKTPESRIADPSDPSRVFSWLICESYDDKGNALSYQYKAENSDKVDLAQAAERNRNDTTRSAQRYIKHVFYGNRTPYFPDLTATKATPLPTDWCFELVFDYGEHDLLNPVPQETGVLWDCRLDPFSTYRSTFEVRTYRLCRRALMFHHFAAETNVGLNCLVRSTDLTYTPALPPPDPTQPFYSYLLSATQTGYRRNGPATYLANSLPPLEFTYTVATVDETVLELDAETLQNLPYGIDGSRYRWVDLDGEGLSGILTEQAGSWFYKANLSPAIGQVIDGVTYTSPQFAPVELVARQPSLATLGSGRQQLMDLSGDGQLDLVQFEGPTPGYFERTEDRDWEPFATFPSLPVLDWRNPNLKFIDLTGDGFPDLLISEDDAFWWHTSLATDGFGRAQRVPQALDEEKGPKLVFSDGTESIFLADMSGDGLTDLVRIRSGEVCYWPNLSQGRFGSKITMDQSPRFESRDLFDGRRVRLADIDGTGTADIIYFTSGAVQLYFNQSGNAWAAKRVLNHYRAVDSISSVTAMDLLGNGTACLVWSSSLPGNTRRPIRYIDLMGGQKPHLLIGIRNNLGAETLVQYSASTKFYVADKLSGTPWVTRLPFPVHVVEQVQTNDYISRNLFVTRYSYHHGYFDGVEREFRGFGRVDQFDTEEFATLNSSSDFPKPVNIEAESNLPPVCTKTWFHTGAFFGEIGVSKHMEHEYYDEGDSSTAFAGLTTPQQESMLLDDTVLPTTILLPDSSRLNYDLSGEEMREACRALRGSILRQEVYALDGTAAADRPYSVSERNYTIEVFQPQGPNKYGVFFSHPRETIDFHYERVLYKVNAGTLVDSGAPPPAKIAADPRVTHTLTLAVDPFGNVLQSASVGYGRRYRDPALTPVDQAKQTASLGATLSTYTENTFTIPVLADDVHRNPLPAQSSTYQLVQVQPDATQADVTNLFGFLELATKIQKSADGLHDILFENLHPAGLNAGEPYRRLIGCSRTYYRGDDMALALLPLGTLDSRGLPGNTFKLAFTPGLITKVFERGGTALLPTPPSVLGSVAPDGGGYVDLDVDGHWWIPAGRIYYALAPATPAQEQTQALAHFFLPRRFEDPFGNPTSVDYDVHDLLVAKTTDAVQPVGNIVTAANDYRVLAPFLTTDPNGNQAAVSFDVLGMVVATAVMGKTTEILGDKLSGFDPDPSQATIDAFYTADDPHTLAGGLLGSATTRVVYDVHKFLNTGKDPVFAATLARETHVSDLSAGHQTEIQITFSYSDGFGREIQKKIQAEPGPVVDKGPVVDPRWVGSGWTIYNNKGKPVRQYEPFFSQLPTKGHQFEFGMQVGVSQILFYDPIERVLGTVHANHTYEKVVFDPWHQATWDVNDTVLQTDPTADPDVGSFFKRLASGDYSPTWFALEIAKPAGDPDHDAAVKASAHANTPALAYFDTLARTFLNIADNAGAGQYQTHIELDIQNNQRSMTDALGREVMTYDYDVQSSRIHQASMEAGERWMLNDVGGKSIRAWNSRGHNFRTTYDVLRRPLGRFVLGTDPINSDARTTAAEVLYETIDYGEGQPSDQALNLRTQIFQQHDSAGVSINMVSVGGKQIAFDFKGNLLGSSRQFVQDHKALPDWSKAAPPFLADVFVSTTQYDALNRTLAATLPDASVLHPTYNKANLLETISVNLQGAGAATSFVANIDYNAKGQRVLIEYGNLTSTAFIYNPQTFRLVHLTTVRAGFPVNQQTVQDLAYTYDPIGNIAHIQDDADIHNVVYFNNQRVEPSNDYTYDAIYRLISAGGREQLGLAAGAPLPPTPTSYNDVPRIHLPHPGDGNAMGTYTEQYVYDAVGNFLQFGHTGNIPPSVGWTRSYFYNEASQLEPAKFSNRLTRTTVSGATPLVENYTYDLHGNTASMPQLQLIQWDFKDQLLMTQRQKVNDSDTDGNLHQGERTYYVYNAAGERVRKITESARAVKMKERFYLGSLEVYREYDGAGNTTLERQSLHVLDDKRRIALVETNMSAPPSASIRYQFDNHLGTACLELDDIAAVITYEEYYPFGSTSYQAGRTLAETSLKRYRYIGKERDDETGLYYCVARYCCPWLGRWISTDPKGIAGGSPNLYIYANGNPVVLRDPNGRDPDEEKKPEATPEKKKSLQEQLDELPEPDPPPEKKKPQPPVYNPGPTQTAGLANDVHAGKLNTEINYFQFVLTPQDKDVGYLTTGYLQIHVRGRTSDTTEQGLLFNFGGTGPTGGRDVAQAHPGSSYGIGTLQYTLHTGTLYDPNVKTFQRTSGNYLNAGLAFNNPDASTPVNFVASYIHARSFLWGGGDKGVDVNVGVTGSAVGQVYNRNVYALASPYVAVNTYFPGPGDTQVNIEAYAGVNAGLGGVAGTKNPDDPAVPLSLRAGGGIGIQKQAGEKGDYTFGFEVLVNSEPTSFNISGPPGLTLPPISVGGVFTVSAY